MLHRSARWNPEEEEQLRGGHEVNCGHVDFEMHMGKPRGNVKKEVAYIILQVRRKISVQYKFGQVGTMK